MLCLSTHWLHKLPGRGFSYSTLQEGATWWKIPRSIYWTAIHIDNLIWSRKPTACHTNRPTTQTLPKYAEPMQVDTYHISVEKREYCIGHHFCLYCGQPGHMWSSCPSRPRQEPSQWVSLPVQALSAHMCVAVPVIITTTLAPITSAMLDSGAAGNFMSLDFARDNKIPLIQCKSLLVVEATDGRPLGARHITCHNWWISYADRCSPS